MTPASEGLSTWLSLLRAQSVIVDNLERTLADGGGLPLSWFEVLIFLTDAPEGRMRMQDLARSAVLSKSGVTRLVDRMQEAELVRRVACDEDRRVVYAEITPAGRSALAESIPLHLRGVEEHFARHLSARELATLRAILRKVLAANGYGEPPCPAANGAARPRPAVAKR